MKIIPNLLHLPLWAFLTLPGLAEEKKEEKPKAEETQSEQKPVEAVPEVDAKDLDALRAQLGKVARVTGFVLKTKEYQGKKGKVNFLNFNGGRFTLVCFEKDLASFPDGPPAKIYDKKVLTVTGTIEEHNGMMEMKLTSPNQVQVVEKTDDKKDKGSKKDDKKADEKADTKN